MLEERLSGGRSQREGAKKGKAWEKVRLGPQVAWGFKKKRGGGQNEWEEKVCVGRMEKGQWHRRWLLAGGVTTQMSTRCITLCRFISIQPSPISLRSMFLSVILYFVEAVPFKEGDDKSQHCDGKRARGGNQHQW